jgi:DNA-binding transcriptional MerR regulator
MNTNTLITYSISDLAKEFDITPRSIRHYEQEQLITPARQGSQRIYTKGDRVRLQLILRGKRIGFSLAEIREIISMYDSSNGQNSGLQQQTVLLISKIKERRLALAQQQKDIKTMIIELNKLEKKLTD